MSATPTTRHERRTSVAFREPETGDGCSVATAPSRSNSFASIQTPTSALPISSSVRTQSAVDGELVEDIVEKTVLQVAQNASLLKYRLLHSRGVTLLPMEQESLLMGEEKDPQRRTIMTEEIGIIRDAVLQHFYPSKRTQLMSANSTNFPSTNAYLLSAPDQKNSLSDIVREQIDVMFQHVFEEVSLRLDARQAEENERIGPNRRLNKAISLQRERLSNVMQENDSLKLRLKELDQANHALRVSNENREQYHKEQLSAYLKEVAILKEQLYRTYRDRTYVGKEIDILPPVTIDDDSCEDVSVDQLLQYRRTMRGVDQHIAVLKNKIKALEDDVQCREQAMQQLQERTRAKELSMAGAQKELDDMNGMVVALEREKEDLIAANKQLAAEIHFLKTNVPQTNSVASQATEEEERARAATYKNIETNVAIELEKVEAMREFDKGVSERDRLKKVIVEMEEKAKRERAALEAKCADLEKRASYAERRQEDLKKISEAALERQSIAEKHAAEVVSCASMQAGTLAKELKIAQDEVVTLRSQNATLCLAYTGMWERLNALKTKAGLSNYKQRANEHHFQRAETAIRQANERIMAAEARCRSEVENAEARVALVEHNNSFLLEDIRVLKRKHKSDLSAFERRIGVVEAASAALLQDYNRLREEHLRMCAEAAIKSEAHALHSNSQPSSRLGSASSVTSPLARQRSLAAMHLATNAATRQTFAFEVLASADDTAASTSTDTMEAVTDWSGWEEKFAAVAAAVAPRLPEATETTSFEGRKVRPQQLPAMVAKECENALLCAVGPLMATITRCIEVDAQLAQRAVMAEQAAARKKPSQLATPQITAAASSKPSTIADFARQIAADGDMQLLSMGLGEQRETVAWMKLRAIAALERSLRQVLQRLHNVSKETKIIAIDTSPLPVSLAVDEMVDRVTEQARVSTAKNDTSSTKPTSSGHGHPKPVTKPHAYRSATPPAAAQRTSNSSMSNRADVSGTSLDAVNTTIAAPLIASHHEEAAGSSCSSATGGTPRKSPTMSDHTHSNAISSHRPQTVAVSTQTVGDGSAAGSKRRPAARADSQLWDQDEALQAASLATADHDVLESKDRQQRPCSTGSRSPASRHRSRMKLGQGALSNAVSALPLLRAGPVLPTIASSLSTTGPAATPTVDDTVMRPSVANHVAPLEVRSEAAVESELPFGNALSLNKEYAALRQRLDRAVGDLGRPPPTAAVRVTSESTTNAPQQQRLPSWQQFKMQRRQDEARFQSTKAGMGHSS